MADQNQKLIESTINSIRELREGAELSSESVRELLISLRAEFNLYSESIFTPGRGKKKLTEAEVEFLIEGQNGSAKEKFKVNFERDGRREENAHQFYLNELEQKIIDVYASYRQSLVKEQYESFFERKPPNGLTQFAALVMREMNGESSSVLSTRLSIESMRENLYDSIQLFNRKQLEALEVAHFRAEEIFQQRKSEFDRIQSDPEYQSWAKERLDAEGIKFRKVGYRREIIDFHRESNLKEVLVEAGFDPIMADKILSILPEPKTETRCCMQGFCGDCPGNRGFKPHIKEVFEKRREEDKVIRRLIEEYIKETRS